MAVIALHPDTGQPLRGEDGDIALLEDVAEIVAQDVRVRLRLLRGEVLTRQDLGMPGDDNGDGSTVLLEKGVTPVEIANVVRGVIRTVDGILRVDEVTPDDVPDASGKLRVFFRATTDTGEQIEGSELV